MKKQIVLLIFLLTVLTGVISAQIINRELPVPQVPDAVVSQAKESVDLMLDAGRKRNVNEMKKTWVKLPSGKEAGDYMTWIGKDFKGEFLVANSAVVPGEPDAVILYGNFDPGFPVEVILKKNGDMFKIVKMNVM